jgi:hypothetical protein
MASSSEDLRDNRRVKFISKREKEHQQQLSSSASNSDEENEDFEIGTTPDMNMNSVVKRQSFANNQIYINNKSKKKRAQWEVIEGYRDSNLKVQKPQNTEGILLKRRNWPMKGWHKRYFILADGIMSYGKSKSDMSKNKLHGTINAYLSIVSYIASSRRILIDSSTQSSAFVCHLKARSQSDFDSWIEHLKQHRLYYQYKYTQQYSPQTSQIAAINISQNANLVNISNNNNHNNTNINNANNTRPANIIINQSQNQPPSINDLNLNQKPINLDDSQIDNQFKKVEESLMNLSRVLSSLYISSLTNSTHSSSSSSTVYNQAPVQQPPQQQQQASSSSSSKFLFARKLLHDNKPKSADYLQVTNPAKIHASKSNPNLINNEIQINDINASNNTNVNDLLPVLITSMATSVTTANNVNNGSSTNFQNLSSSPSQTNSSKHIRNLSNASIILNESDFKMNFYQGAKSINDQLIYLYQQLLMKKQNLIAVGNNTNLKLDASLSRSQRSQSIMSSVSFQDSEFHDAIEYFTSDDYESDDDSEQDSDAEVAENGAANRTIKAAPAIVPEELQSQKILTRRRKLPAVAPDGSQVSVWGIMRKAIGKDLSKISLPVILNEPLGILQRLCEEVEYSDLLDTANSIQDPYDRMIYIAAFVISGYSSSYYRNGAKDFNPLLGETYELVRPDKGWKYVAEQVSHHPPISACHCISKSFIHEQVFHAKIKFWGKSMEVHPEGYTRVTLPKFNETYQWNKIVMYVHNVMGASRKIEHYGEITIRSTNGTSCTITFPKSSNSSQKNEFYGNVIYDNVVKRKIFGQWHEAFLSGTDNTAKTIWRMGAMPEDSNLFYGFTRFAIELNEFTENLNEEIPITDSRFRPDQRNLENGDVEKAEREKHRIEEIQRNKRKEMEAKGEHHQPLWFSVSDDDILTGNSKTEKEWIFNNQYWIKKENPGFGKVKNSLPVLW